VTCKLISGNLEVGSIFRPPFHLNSAPFFRSFIMPFARIDVTPPLTSSVWAAPPTAIVLHATAGSTARSSVDHLRSVGLGYHFIIARDGRDTAKSVNSDGSNPIVFFCTPLENRAAHVGSNIPIPGSGGRIANRCGIGISLANRQNGEDYTSKQVAVLSEIIEHVKARLPSVTHLTTHAVIQPWNRVDPLKVLGKPLAEKHGLSWFEPTAAVVEQFRPRRQGRH
jgi:N-acetyl-anhydromuramyl-L-alanine amidase AmpD